MKNYFLYILRISIILLINTSNLIAQTYGDYTFYSPQNNTKAYLIDMSSNTFHTWTFLSTKKTGYSSYLLPGGNVVRTVANSGNSLSGGGITGAVQIVDWNSNVLWDFVYSSTTYCLHHDICPLPNGNVLMISYDVKTTTDATNAGCSKSIAIHSEKIIEVKPTGATTGTIVWEWKLWDHLCQNYNSAKSNYVSSIVQNPQLMNINYNTAQDWMHMNGIDFNEALNQIVVSSHALNEIYVIDHSTTTEQAASHTGGNSGKGGDFLYRWGNPASYSATGTTDFNVVHDAHWAPVNCPYPNYLVGFNNKGGTGSKSCIDVIAPPYNGYNYTLTLGSAYTPSTYTYRHTSSYTAQDMGNSQQLPNGNILVCVPGNPLYEVNSSGTTVWSKTVSGTIPQAFRFTLCELRGPIVTVSASSAEVCSGSSVTLSSSAKSPTETTSNYTYSWSSNPEGFSSTLQNPTITPTLTTTYTVTVTNTSISCSKTANIIVTVKDLPVITTSEDVTINSGETTTLTASGGATYLWSTNETTAEIKVSPKTNTTYTVSVTNSNGCTNFAEIVITVKAVNTLMVTATASLTTICSGTNTQLNVTVSGNSGNCSYLWYAKPEEFNSSIINPVVSPTTTTTYNVTVSNGTNTATSAIIINVNELPTATINPASSTTFCEGGSVVLNANTGTGLSYVWEKNNTEISGTNSAAYTVNVAGSYKVIVTNSNSCVNTSEPVEIIVNPLPIPDLGDDILLYTNSSTNLSVKGDYSSYLWSDGTNSSNLNLNGNDLNPGTYTYYLTVTNNYNCSASDSINITVIQATYSISGTVNYNNTDKTLLSGVMLKLLNSENTTINNYTTGADGNYIFNNIPNGNYKIEATSTNTWGGADPGDALMINRVYLGAYTINDNLNLYAADVNNDYSIDPGDALMVNRKYIGAIDTFNILMWLFDTTLVTVSNSDVEQNIKGLCSGDVNGDYIPNTKKVTNYKLNDSQ